MPHQDGGYHDREADVHQDELKLLVAHCDGDGATHSLLT